MYCTKCGNKLDDDANFCSACGYKQVTVDFNSSNNKSDVSTSANTSTLNISDKWLWSLATIPTTASILLSLFIHNATLVVTIVTIGLNILFLTLDVKHLKKSGVNPNSWLWLGFVLVPVYLFVRAAKTTKNVAPGIVWCVIFVLSFII